jgi:glycosyltransferase involved in cell wall biosynthesis
LKNGLKIVFSGLLRSTASWPHISRCLIKSLSKEGIPVKIIPKRGFLYDKTLFKDEQLDSLVDASVEPEEAAAICFDHPRFYKDLKGSTKTALLVYETFPIPQEWVENINRYLDLVFVPNAFNEKLFIRSGVEKSKIRIVPYGYDEDLMRSAGTPAKTARPPGQETRFLVITMPHKRKGINHLLEAFCTAFTRDDPVSLTIKSAYSPKAQGRRMPWETEPIPDTIKKTLKRFLSPPRMIYLEKGLTDSEMLFLYREHDVYLQPSFAEGFGLAVLEAMACGIPCMVTGRGGQRDFCDKKNSLLISSTKSRRKGMAYDMGLCAKRISVDVPDKKHLIELLRFSHHNPSAMKKLSFAARESISHLTWKNSAKILADLLRRSMEHST